MKNTLLLLLTLIVFRVVQAQVPTITTFSPASGAIGSSVTINGTGFNATAAQNIVFFGATQATVTSASPTSLTVTVPVGATYQYISVTNLTNNLTTYSAKPFIVTFTGAIAFDAKQDILTLSIPKSVSIGDIDGDGKADLAVAHYSGIISVYRNTSTSGTVSFATRIDVVAAATGSGSIALKISDIDGDGKQDLIVANYTQSYVSILRNTSTTGTISFASKVDFASRLSFSLSIGDIDGDGKPDLVMGNRDSNSISVLRNTSTLGEINFASNLEYATIGSTLNMVSIGDIDGDNKPDIVACGSTGWIFRNTSTSGSISFAAQSFSGAASSISIGDIDGDGKPDVVTTGGTTMSVFRNTSIIGTISLATKVDFTAGAGDNCIADVDGDGKPDLVVANQSGSSTSVLRNTSTMGVISFTPKVDFSVGQTPISIGAGDIDGDGKPDLVAVNQVSTNISILRQASLQTQGSLTANGPFCVSGIGQLTWTVVAGAGPYTVVYNDGIANRTVTNVTSGTPFNVFTNPVTGTTTYTLVSVTYPDNSVQTSGFIVSSAAITVNPMPMASISGTTAVCKDVTAPNIIFTGSNGTAPYIFTYKVNNGSNQTVNTGSGNSVTVSQTTTLAGTFNYTLVSVQDATGCSQNQSSSAVIIVNPLPTASISGTTAVCKDVVAPNVTFTGSGGTTPYTFIYKVNNGSNQMVTTTSGNSVTVTQTTAIAGIFTYTLVSVQDANGCSQTQNGSASITVNAPPVVSTPAAWVFVDSTIILSPTSGGTWISNNPTKATVTNGGVVTGIAEGVVNFTFMATATGCTATTSNIIIKPTPVVVQAAEFSPNYILVPQFTFAQISAMSSPKKGMIVYDLTNDCLRIYNGSTWKKIVGE